MRQTRFDFDSANVAAPDALSPALHRLAWLLVEVLRHRETSFRDYHDRFGLEKKTFVRDLSKLSKLGEPYGLLVARARSGVVRLLTAPEIAGAGADAGGSLRAVYEALGAIVAIELRGGARDSNVAPPFLKLAAPKLHAGSKVAELYTQLRAAYVARARVRFKYPRSGDYGQTPLFDERTVEPHLVTYYDGRYYLVAYDTRPKTSNWRQFALDRIVGPVSRAGTFRLRDVPDAYGGLDAIGLFKSQAEREVGIALSARIAGAVEARQWQARQRFVRLPDGSALLTLRVNDLGEAVRWALSFAPEAHVVSPPEAVALELRFLDTLAARHRTVASRSA